MLKLQLVLLHFTVSTWFLVDYIGRVFSSFLFTKSETFNTKNGFELIAAWEFSIDLESSNNRVIFRRQIPKKRKRGKFNQRERDRTRFVSSSRKRFHHAFLFVERIKRSERRGREKKFTKTQHSVGSSGRSIVVLQC